MVGVEGALLEEVMLECRLVEEDIVIIRVFSEFAPEALDSWERPKGTWG